MTAHALESYRGRCLEAGMDDYISKPLRRKELLAMVDKWTERIEECRLNIEDRKNKNDDIEKTSAINHQSSTLNPPDRRRTGRQSSTVNNQSSIFNNQSSIFNIQSKDAAPMNFERAVEEFERDREFLMEVLEGFMGNVRAQIGTIRQAISDGDADQIREEAHSIKGGAANLTADNLSEVALELENIGKSGVLERGIPVIERLEKELHRLEVYVNNR